MTAQNKPNRKLGVHELVTAEHSRTEYVATPEIGTTFEEMACPGYWASVAKGLRAYDRIEIRPADGSWWAELLVRNVEPFSAVVFPLQYIADFSPKSADDPAGEVPDGYEIVFRGRAKHSVKRLVDNVFLQDGLATKADAARWLKNHLERLK